MKIAFIHYHLKTGGVTTVLKQQLDAVSSQWETLVLTGLPPETPFPARIVHIPELGYSSEYRHEIDPDDVAQTILKAIERIFEDSCDVLHVHNPTLAKNRHFIKILRPYRKEAPTCCCKSMILRKMVAPMLILLKTIRPIAITASLTGGIMNCYSTPV